MSNLLSVMDVVKLNRKVSPWTQIITSEIMSKELISEIEELKIELEKKDFTNIKDELGDVLWDTLTLIHIYEQEGKFTEKEVCQNIINKIMRRKPHIFEGKNLTANEEREQWERVKKIEKGELLE